MIAGTEEQGVETPEERAFRMEMMKDSTRRLQAMKNKYAGEDCFAIGTGPSLLKTDFSLIRDEYMFGCNLLWRGFERFNILPQFYGIATGDYFPRYGPNVLEYDMQLFLARFADIQYLRNYDEYHSIAKREPILLRSLLPEMTPPDTNLPYEKGSGKFSKDASKGTYSGWTVIIDTCLEVGYYLGFNRIILLGCDCNYGDIPIGKPHTATGRSYFFSESLADYEYLEHDSRFANIEYCYGICKKAFEEDGREIIYATPNGSLNVFPYMKLEDVVK